MKILVISHNMFSSTTAMGRTLKGFFEGWDTKDLAQLTFHSEVPTDPVCQNYFRITDVDMVKALPKKKARFKIFQNESIDYEKTNPRIDTGFLSSVYQYSRRRTSLIYMMRDLLWRPKKWKSDELNNWISDFNPDAVFFASGDYSFSYEIALTISKERNIPLVMYCCDDYYLNVPPKYQIFKTLRHKQFMSYVRSSLEYVSLVITICDKMNDAYIKAFGVNAETIYTSSSYRPSKVFAQNVDRINKFTYAGNLGLQRHQSLLILGKSLKVIFGDDESYFIHVYSSEKRKKIVKYLNHKNGIVFHGEVNKEELDKIVENSEYVLHVESQKRKEVARIKYSISTKIPELLSSGVNVLAYGPAEVASIEYIKENNAGFVLDESSEIKDRLNDILSASEDEKLTKIDNAKKLVKQNHDGIKNRERFTMLISDVITNFKKD